MIKGMAHLVVLAVLVASCTKVEPTPPPAPPPAIAPRDEPVLPPAPPLQPRRDTTTRAKLRAGRTLPVHGMFIHVWGLGGESRLTLDLDTTTLRLDADLMGEGKTTRQRKISPHESGKLMALAEAAWRETPSGPVETATDIREDLYVLDGDDAFYLSGYPLRSLGHPARPAAAAVMAAMFAAKL
jgi:hypothetical protein